MKAVQIFKDGFDNMENHNAKCSELLGTFIEQNGLTAHGNAAEFISKMKPNGHYLGYDGNIYPKYRMERIEIG